VILIADTFITGHMSDWKHFANEMTVVSHCAKLRLVCVADHVMLVMLYFCRV